MLSFSISYWDLIKCFYFAITTEIGDSRWKEAQWQGDFPDNSPNDIFFKFLMLCLGQSIWHKVSCYWEHVEEHIVNLGSILRTYWELDENTLGTKKSKISITLPLTVHKRKKLGHMGFQPHAPKGSLSFWVQANDKGTKHEDIRKSIEHFMRLGWKVFIFLAKDVGAY